MKCGNESQEEWWYTWIAGWWFDFNCEQLKWEEEYLYWNGI